MDQRELVKVLKKQYFWGVSVLIVLVSLACWWTSTAAINKRYTTRKGEIDKHVKAMTDLKNRQNPPNPKVIEAVQRDKIAWIKENVADAWGTLYKDQQRNNKYPESLGKDFRDVFENLGPQDTLSDGLRQSYGLRVKDHWKKVFAVIGIPFPDREKAGAKPDPGRSAPAEVQGIVDWDAGDAERFLARFQWVGTPSTAQVRLAQEDLWVYEALLRVIKNTNGEATNRYAAAVKRIEALDIGPDFFAPARRSPAAAPMRRDRPGGPPLEGPVRGAPLPGAGRASAGPAPPPSESGAPAAESGVPDNRYVNDKFEGLKGGDKPPYEEFKMMPVRMRLVIDQRRLAKLLVECANSSMPIEVRKLTILPRGEATQGRAAGKQGGAVVSAAPPPHETAVDLEGRIYIFNPPQVTSESAAAADKILDAGAVAAGKTEAGKTEAGKTEAVESEAGPKPEAADGKTAAPTAKTGAAAGKPDAASKPEP